MILGLINLGAAGAVIIVVIVFIKYLEKRDDKLSTSLDRFSTELDKTTNEVSSLRTDVKTVLEVTRACNTQPKRKENAWG